MVKNLHEQSHFHFITKEICDKFDSGFGDYFITTTRSSEKLSPDLKDMQGISICFPYKNDAFTIGEIYKTYYSANSNSEKKIAFAIEESGRPSKWALFLDTLLEAVKKQVKIAASKKATALALPIQRKRKALTVDEILSPPENKKFVLDIHVEFEIIATNLLVHSVIANCASSDMNGNEIIFNVNPGIGNPKSYGPGNPKSYGPGNPKSYGPGNPKSYGPGIPGELTTSPDSEKQKELLDGYGYKLVDGSGAEL